MRAPSSGKPFGRDCASNGYLPGNNILLETQIQAAARSRAEAPVTADDQFLSSQRAQVVALAMLHRLPVASEFREFAEAGSLCSYGASLTDLARRAVTYVATPGTGSA